MPGLPDLGQLSSASRRGAVAVRMPPALRHASVALVLLHAAVALAGVDVNHAREADLDGVRGIGPAMSSRILAERARGPFQD
ncbi:helix-hairpin-helix domain-containing protein, partial [Diaphorobacter sp.]|uniref:ComEA family DNA-binding protein n=1 Tax=Diaphorobacter sp. TaxID=1934310 RepID=UPI00338E185D